MAAYDRWSLAQARQLWKQALTLADKDGAGLPQIVDLLNHLGEVEQRLEEWSEARKHHQWALESCRGPEVSSPRAARTLLHLATVSRRQGDLREAKAFAQQALALYEKQEPDAPNVSHCLLELAHLLSAQRDDSEAAKTLRRALEIQERSGRSPALTARILYRLEALALESGDRQAQDGYTRRREALLTHLRPGDPEGSKVVDALLGLAQEGQETDDVTSASALASSAQTLCERVAPDSVSLATVLVHLTRLELLRGEWGKAEGYARQTLAVAEQRAPDSPQLGECRLVLSALPFVRIGLKAAVQRLMLGLELGVPAAELETSATYLERAWPIGEKLKPRGIHMAAALMVRSLISYERKDWKSAYDNGRQALSLLEVQPSDALRAYVRVGLGVFARKLAEKAATEKNEPEAERLRKEAAEHSAQGLLLIAGSNRNITPAAIASTLFLSASPEGSRPATERDEEKAREAWERARVARPSLPGDEARQAFARHFAPVGEHLIRVLIARGKISEAFQTLEENRAQGLRQLLAERRTLDGFTNPELIRRYQASLEVQLQARQELEKAEEPVKKAHENLKRREERAAEGASLAEARMALAAAQASWRSNQAAYDAARLEVERHWRELAQSASSASPVPLDAGKAPRSLPTGTLFAAFLTGEKDALLFLTDGGGRLQVYPVQLDLTKLILRVESLRKTVALENVPHDSGERAAALASDNQDERLKEALELFQSLFPKECRDRLLAPEVKRIVISPDGPLWRLPFGALVTAAGEEPAYLGLQKGLVYTQSLSVYTQELQQPAPRLAAGKVTALVVGNPLFDEARRKAVLLAGARTRAGSQAKTVAVENGKNSRQPPRRRTPPLSRKRSAQSTPSGSRSALAPLPGAEEEAANVAKLVAAAPQTGVGPTEAWFRKEAPRADLIHLATHGNFNGRLPMSSWIHLAVPERPSEKDTRNDGKLHAWEILEQLRLRADLVVLSACVTGLGDHVAGEGLIGMTRALQVVGARSIVASQWPVYDPSTRVLMVRFHKGLTNGLPKDEALRQAMVGLVKEHPKEWKHPYYWAPFLLVGDPENYLFNGKKAAHRPLSNGR